jgi:hypothetical protein
LGLDLDPFEPVDLDEFLEILEFLLLDEFVEIGLLIIWTL